MTMLLKLMLLNVAIMVKMLNVYKMMLNMGTMIITIRMMYLSMETHIGARCNHSEAHRGPHLCVLDTRASGWNLDAEDNKGRLVSYKFGLPRAMGETDVGRRRAAGQRRIASGD